MSSSDFSVNRHFTNQSLCFQGLLAPQRNFHYKERHHSNTRHHDNYDQVRRNYATRNYDNRNKKYSVMDNRMFGDKSSPGLRRNSPPRWNSGGRSPNGRWSSPVWITSPGTRPNPALRRTSPGTRPDPALRETSSIRDGSEGREAYRRKRTYSQMRREDTRFGDSRNMERRSEVSDKRSEVNDRSEISDRRSKVSNRLSEDVACRERHTPRYKNDRRYNTSHRTSRNTHKQQKNNSYDRSNLYSERDRSEGHRSDSREASDWLSEDYTPDEEEQG